MAPGHVTKGEDVTAEGVWIWIWCAQNSYHFPENHTS